MLTVHILPPTHELIAARDEAMAADASLIEEVMVIIDNGRVTAIHTPPKGMGYRFESDDSWIRDAIVSAHRSGMQAGICSEQDGKPDKLKAPAGWTLWSDAGLLRAVAELDHPRQNLLDAVDAAPADESVQATIDRVLPVGA